MDTVDFLNAVLPRQGRRCLGTLNKGKFHNYFGASNEWLAEGVTRLANSDHNAYFGCATFHNSQSRTQDNVAWVRSFWLDIDTQEGKPKETYANRKVAAGELSRFCIELKLPQPMLVSSGYGIHAYWPCIEDLTREEWKETATLLKQATKVWGLAADPSRTSDEASVLRPVGTQNIKNGVHKDVRLLRNCEEIDRAQFHARLHVYLKANDELPEVRPTSQKQENINSDLMVQREYKPSSAHRIAKHCAVIHEMRESRGDMDQPTWYGAIGVLAFTEEGGEICHEWSDGHAKYSFRETEAKIAQALKYAPTSCEKFCETRDSLCKECPHFGKIKSPISLGIEENEPQYTPQADGTVPDLPHKHLHVHNMPDGFGWGVLDGKTEVCLWKEMWEPNPEFGKDESAERWTATKVGFSDVLFYPSSRILERNSHVDWGYKMNMVLNDKKGKQHEFILDNKLVASGGTELIAELGRREIVSDLNNAVHAYLKAWTKTLRDNYTASKQISQFGWHDGSFAIGGTMITPNGEDTTLLAKAAPKLAKNLVANGSLDLWKYAMDKLYNVENFEAQQFCVLASFAAPLYRMRAEKGGITVYIATADSSYGKTTACRAGMTAWGDGMSSLLLQDYTPNSLYEYIGAMNNLPVAGDEMTNISNDQASRLVYSVNNGEGRMRLNGDSELKDTANWSTIFIGNGNNLLSEKLASHRSNSEGEQMRLWEFIPRHKSKMGLVEFDSLVGILKENYGLAGPAFMKYVVENYDTVKQRLTARYADVVSSMKMVDKERNWASLISCVLLARDILEELDLLKINYAGMRKWIMDELNTMRNTAVQTVADPAEQFGRMLADLQSGILVTKGRGMLAKGESARIIADLRGNASLVGRYIYPMDANTKEVLILSVAAAREWATKHGVPLKEIENSLTSGGVISRPPARMKLGQGVAKYAGSSASVLCWELDAVKMNELLGDDPIASKLQVVGQTPKPSNIAAVDLSEDDNRDGENYSIDDLLSS